MLGGGILLRPADGGELSLRASNPSNNLAIMQGDANSGEILACRNGDLITARNLPGRAVEFALRLSW